MFSKALKAATSVFQNSFVKGSCLFLIVSVLVGQPLWATINDAYDRGGAQMVQMNYNEAIRSFDEAIGANHEFSDAYFKRGQCYLYLKDYDKAVTDFNNVLKRESRNADALLYRGTSYANLGDDGSAIRDFGRALQINPDLAQAHVETGGGAQGPRQGRLRRTRSAGAGESSSGELVIKRGNAFIKLGQNDRAVEDFVAAMKTGSDTQAAYPGRGLASVAKDKKGEPEHDGDLPLVRADGHAFQLKASAYLNVKQPKKAIEDLNDALEVDPQNDSFYFKRGCAYEELGNLTRACEEYSHAAYINPQAKYFLARAHCYHQMNKPVLASADIRHARQLNPRLPRRIIFKDDVELTPDQ
jgi:tetratricopeptide (TPR) repeat protein